MENKRCTFIVIYNNNNIILNREYISHVIPSQILPNTYIITMVNGDKHEIDYFTFEDVIEMLK